MVARKLKIAVVSPEVVPFAKTGGLADVAGALGKYLMKNKVDVRIITPFYSVTNTTRATIYPVDFLQGMHTWFGNRMVEYSVHMAKIPGTEAEVYFIFCPELYNRISIYTEDVDEYLRFALLNRAAIEICQHMAWAPDIFHCNDWQTGLIPVYLKTIYSWDSLFKKTKVLLSIHNIGYQGHFKESVIGPIGLNDYRHLLDDYDLQHGVFNFMKTGIIHSDMLSTVSKTYAQEIQTAEYGAGLDPMLIYRKKILYGIVNGVDYDEWNPEHDPYIKHNYSADNLEEKQKNKKDLLKFFKMKYSKIRPVIGMVSRLVEQKGLDIIRMVAEDLVASKNVQLIILGNGELQYETYFEYLKNKFPDKVGFYKGYNNELAHLIEAGADIFLMPSRYEPCGLNQIYSLKYGTIPIVRKTGGLADTVELYDWITMKGTGFVFADYTAAGLDWALNHALNTFKHKDAWPNIMKNAMKQDFSWDHQIKEYLALYKKMLK